MPRSSSSRRRIPGVPGTGRALLPLLAALLAACADHAPTGPDDQALAARAAAPVRVSASLTASEQQQIRGMSVEVTGPGIASPIVANLTVNGAAVSGTVTVPVGGNRTFAVRAFDGSGIETHSGSMTTTVTPGANIALNVPLIPRLGGTPISVSIGTYAVTLTPPQPTVAVGSAITLTAAVSGTNGAAVPASVQVDWALVNPTLAAITPGASSTTATLTGLVEGTTDVVVTYQGFSARVTLVVTAAGAQGPAGTTLQVFVPAALVFP